MVRRPSNISLPSLKSVLDEEALWSGNPVETTNDIWFSAGPIAEYQPSPRDTRPEPPVTPKKRTVSSPLEYRGFRPINQEDQTTPKHISAPLVYPSPASEDLYSDVEMGDANAWGYKSQPSSNNTNDIRVTPQVRSPPTSQPESTLTPTIVHYRPNGVPNVKSRKLSSADIPKSRTKRPGQVTSPKTPGEVKFKIVKWDRTSDKGTAPLNMEPRPQGPRSCTLCSILKRKVYPLHITQANVQCDRTDGARPNETHPCAMCQKNNFVCQFIAPSQLREGTTSPPTLECLKIHCDQAQRLRTQELEERCVKLEHELEMATMEARIQSGYISNLKVYEGIVNGYVWRLRERLEKLDPRCRLLEVNIPTMPKREDAAKMQAGEETGAILLSDVVEGMTSESSS